MTRFGRNESSFDGAPLFEGPFLGGFECSVHKLEDGRRLDLQAATRHDELAAADYQRLRDVGITACRDGVSWVAADAGGNRFDFSRASRMAKAADACGVEVIWDLLHFGWPDDVDVFDPRFPSRFAKYAHAFARFLSSETAKPPFITPINEMSFLAWAGGDVRCMNPFEAARGVELKSQLVLATIEAIEAIRQVWPAARFLQPEPVINIVAAPEHPKTNRRVESDNLLQYQAWDMLSGRVWPSLGGHPKYLDVVGVNFYPDNQFMLDGTTIARGDGRYRPFSEMLLDVWRRYGRPMLVSETGCEGQGRADWLAYVSGECVQALGAGCELHGITLYPIVSHPGWVDGRWCENGLWDRADASGQRPVHEPLLSELTRQTARIARARSKMLIRARRLPADSRTADV